MNDDLYACNKEHKGSLFPLLKNSSRSMKQLFSYKGAVAHGKRTSQKIQLLKNQSLDYTFLYQHVENILFQYIFFVCGLWLHVMQVDVYKLDFERL